MLDVVIAQICCADRSLIPIDYPAGSRLPNLRFIDWTVLSRRPKPIHNVKEETARLSKLDGGLKQADLRVCVRLLLLSNYLNKALN